MLGEGSGTAGTAEGRAEEPSLQRIREAVAATNAAEAQHEEASGGGTAQLDSGCSGKATLLHREKQRMQHEQAGSSQPAAVPAGADHEAICARD